MRGSAGIGVGRAGAIGAALLLAAIGLLTLWQIFVTGLGALAVEKESAALAKSIADRSPRAASFAAERAFEGGDARGADALALRSLDGSPIDVRALRVRALANGANEGNSVGTRQLLLAARMGWRDLPTQVMLINLALRNGDVVTAAQRIDAVLRLRRLMPEMSAMMRALSTDPSAVNAVADRVAQDPAWRNLYMQDISALPEQELGGQEALVRTMHAAGAPVRGTEQAALLQRMIALQEYRPAHALWREVGDGSALMRPGNGVADPDFSSAADRPSDDEAAIPFEWWALNPVGAAARVDLPPFAPTDPALAVETDGSVAALVATQTIMLSPGRYRFSVNMASDNAGADRLFPWALLCLPSSERPMSKPRIAGKQGAWARLAADFEIPAGGCIAQVLTLSVDRGTVPVAASAWFDRVRIARP